MALVTAFGALAIVIAAVVVAAVYDGSGLVIAATVVVALAATATLAPAIGTLSASVDADRSGVTARRFGRTASYGWDEITEIQVVERGAAVPDGTEYHWVLPSRSGHVVAVPCLMLSGGARRELPALAAPAAGERRGAADEYAQLLERLREVYTRLPETGAAQPDPSRNASIREQTNAMSSSLSA
ncbi:MAG TPA: hypothetical protein VL119_10015 [Acidimicrobiia bacterium]|nr:hypothetical protein [Acidimicrobiia bacterium]